MSRNGMVLAVRAAARRDYKVFMLDGVRMMRWDGLRKWGEMR